MTERAHTGALRPPGGTFTMISARPLTRHRVAITCGLMALFALVLLGRGIRPASATVYVPPNNNLGSARTLSGKSGSINNGIDNATRQSGEPAAAGLHTVWFKWTANFTGTAKFNTKDSECKEHYDTTGLPATVHAFTGTSFANFVQIGGSGSFPVTSGKTYFIDVDGACNWSGYTGTLHLNWNPPANDESTTPQILSGDTGTATGNNRGAAWEPYDGLGESTVWYKWKASAAGTATFSTRGTSVPTQITANLPCTPGVCENDWYNWYTIHSDVVRNNTDTAKITFPVIAGQDISVAVGSDGLKTIDGSPQGDIALQWALNPPANDDFKNAQVLTGPAATASGTNVHAIPEPGEPDQLGAPPKTTVWYSWTAPKNGLTVVQTEGSSFDTLLTAYTGALCPGNYYSGCEPSTLQAIAGNDDIAGALNRQSRLSFMADAGKTYHFAVGGYGGAQGSVMLSVNPPANDDFAVAQVLNGSSGLVSGTTGGSSPEAGEAWHGGTSPDPTVWDSALAPASGPATVTTWGSSIDTTVEVDTGSAVNNLQSIASNNNYGTTLQSKADFTAVAGQKYSFVVSGVAAAEGDIALQWSFAR